MLRLRFRQAGWSAPAPSRTRTYGLLLRRHLRGVAGRCQVWPDVPFGRGESGWTWPGVAVCLWSLAPSSAPRDLVSKANVRLARGPDAAADRGSTQRHVSG